MDKGLWCHQTGKIAVGSLLVTLVFTVLFGRSAYPQVGVGSPEDRPALVQRCNRDLDCPAPIAQQGQEMACLQSRCVSGSCAVAVVAGREVGREEAPSELACFKTPLVCDTRGFPVLSTDPQRRIPVRENAYCPLDSRNQNPCERSACQDGHCVWMANDGADCSSTNDRIGECQKTECRARECRAVADLSKRGMSCINPRTGQKSETSNCRTIEYSCNEVGVCQGSKPQVAIGAECAPAPDQLAPLPQLPSLFRALVQNGASFPSYSCNTADCKLQFCGDNVKNGSEQCDGTDTPPGITCSPHCSICGDTLVRSVDLCRGPLTGVLTPEVVVHYWLRQLGFSTYKDAISTNKARGVLFTYTNEQGNKCWVEHDMYDGPAPGLGVCRDGTYEKFEFHCSTCGDTGTTCYDRFPDKAGLQVMQLGVIGDGNCSSGAAHAAYGKFKSDYSGYESVLTGLDLGYSADRTRVYGAPIEMKRGHINPLDMVTCEVCYWPVCGNGKRTADEECDGSDMPLHAPRGSTCSARCKLEYCGDGKINNNGSEQCDGAALPIRALPGSTCSASCTFHGQLSLDGSGTCTIEPEGETATSVFCRLGDLQSWSEGSYRPRNNAPTLGQPGALRAVEDRVLTSAGRLCQDLQGPDTGYVGTRGAILTTSSLSLNQVGAPYGTVEFGCINKVP